MKYQVFFVLLLFVLGSCSDATNTPHPRGYPRVVYPKKEYQPFDAGYCQFTFQYPKYANIKHDTMFMGEKPPSDCWFNVEVPQLNAILHCTYYGITKTNSFEKLRKDSYELANKHDVKADYIDELPFKKGNTIGRVFDIQGAAASSFQFYVSDSSRHFLRGALYFNSQTRPDSIAPVLNFMKVDVMEMLNTLVWK
jgi:gliding motility-associated lipoprotein GldD